MQINKISNQNSTNFGAIQSIKMNNVLKEKYPVVGRDLLDIFKHNDSAMNFCNKYDTRIEFHALKHYPQQNKINMVVFYDEPKPKTFLQKIKNFFNPPKPIIVSGYGNSLEETVGDFAKSLKHQSAFDYYDGKLSKIKNDIEKKNKAVYEKKVAITEFEKLRTRSKKELEQDIEIMLKGSQKTKNANIIEI